MKYIYLDNSATSYPKAPSVGDALKFVIDQISGNVNRSSFSGQFSGEHLVFETREMLARFFNFPSPENVVFTMNVTQALNFLIKGLLQEGDHCLVSSLEHNAVMRPLFQLEEKGVSFSRIWGDLEGRVKASDLLSHIKPNTKAVIMTHASNVCGTIMPLEEIGEICREKNLTFIIDAAQSAGSLPLDFQTLKADALAFTGHKSLLGPQGIGGFIITKELAQKIDSLITGGTGSFSEKEEPPPYLPDKFEAGTINLPGIAGLKASLQYIEEITLEEIQKKELALTKLFLEGLSSIDDIKICGIKDIKGRTSTISIDCLDFDNANVGHRLAKEYGIQTRCGLHCSPSAHKTLATFPQGTIRFSPGPFNSKEEILYTISSLKKVLAHLKA